MSGLLELIGESNQEMDKVAKEGNFEDQVVEMYKTGWDLAESHLMKAAEDVEESDKGGKKTESKSETPENFKERRKTELMEQMKKSPEKVEEVKKEMEAK